MRLRPRLRFLDISNKILDSSISSYGSNGAAAAAQNLSRRAGSGYVGIFIYVIFTSESNVYLG